MDGNVDARPMEDESDTSDIDLNDLDSFTPPKPYLMQFQQQRLPTFYLAPTNSFTLGALAVCWIVCAALSAVFLAENDKFVSHSVRYDNYTNYVFPVGSAQNDPTLLRSFTVNTPSGSATTAQGKETVVSFTLSKRIPGPVTMFYILDPYYQNFRSFAESGSDGQLLGKDIKKSSLYLCAPFRSPGEYYPKGEERISDPIKIDGVDTTLSALIYNPCGVKAWSLFNDTVSVEEVRTDGLDRLRCKSSDFGPSGDRLTLSAAANPCHKKNIAWDIDFERFRAPLTAPGAWTYNYPFPTDNEFLSNGWYYNEAGHSVPNPEDEDFMAWHATSATSSVRKVWRILDGDMETHDTNGVPIEYRMTIEEFYPTHQMGAEKRIFFMGRENTVFLEAPNEEVVIPLLVATGFSFAWFVIVLVIRCVSAFRRGNSMPHGQPTEVAPDGNALVNFKTTPSKTLEESLAPDSYESGQYVALSVKRQLEWDRQKRNAKGFELLKRAQDLRDKEYAQTKGKVLDDGEGAALIQPIGARH